MNWTSTFQCIVPKTSRTCKQWKNNRPFSSEALSVSYLPSVLCSILTPIPWRKQLLKVVSPRFVKGCKINSWSEYPPLCLLDSTWLYEISQSYRDKKGLRPLQSHLPLPVGFPHLNQGKSDPCGRWLASTSICQVMSAVCCDSKCSCISSRCSYTVVSLL